MFGTPLILGILSAVAINNQITFDQIEDNSVETTKTPTPDDGQSDSESEEKPDKSVLIYVRVSSNEQSENGRSIDSQIEELTSIVDQHPEMKNCHDPIKDEGETGTDFDRDGIQQVARLVQHADITHLMVDNIDRIGRSVAETIMFLHELREKFDVKLLSRDRELDVQQPSDRLQVSTQAMMADFDIHSQGRSAKRGRADNFIKDKQWYSWYETVPFGYRIENPEGDNPEESGWLCRIDSLEPVVKDIVETLIDTKSYKRTIDDISEEYEQQLMECDWVTDELTRRQVKSIGMRPLYRGAPTIPVTDLKHYDPNPSVTDPDLQFVSEEKHQRAQAVCDEIYEENSTNPDILTDVSEYADEFDPHIIESISEPIRLVCPECSSDLSSDGHQETLDGDLGSREYLCTNEDCGYNRKWPRESELELMQVLDEFDEFHDLL